jgi:hypothetical protein
MDDEPEEIERCVSCTMPLTQAELDCEYLTLECFDCARSGGFAHEAHGWCGRMDRHHDGREPGESEDQYNGG